MLLLAGRRAELHGKKETAPTKFLHMMTIGECHFRRTHGDMSYRRYGGPIRICCCSGGARWECCDFVQGSQKGSGVNFIIREEC